MKKYEMMLRIIIFCFCFLFFIQVNADIVIRVPRVEGDATSIIREVLEKAARYKGEKVTIELPKDTLHISRKNASSQLYHISNTTSSKENPDPTKHIGIWLKKLENITIKGNGCLILTHGEMTSFVIDSCKNIKLQNFRLDAADPSVVEITIIDKGKDYITFEILPPTNFEIESGSLAFVGEGWRFGEYGNNSPHRAYAQIYDRDKDMTLRTPLPIKNYKSAVHLGNRLIRVEFEIGDTPDVRVGDRYQIRHGVRNEVCMFINRSKDVFLNDIDFNFMGNFGVVAQFSENLTYERINCEPHAGSGRTNAGFADFLQFSSCRGLLKVMDSNFNGSHDDPINIHGTHLQVDKIISPKEISISYKHRETFGFLPCEPGDEFAIVSCASLNDIGSPVRVKKVEPIDDYSYAVTLENELPEEMNKNRPTNYVVENLSWVPEVIIKGNNFRKTPTRGILITTRGKSLIEKNNFYRIPMASILVADDARSWYESGPVKDLTIRDNNFYDCSSPVIQVTPEIPSFEKPVHENISLEGNLFINPGIPVIKLASSSHIKIIDNIFEFSSGPTAQRDKMHQLVKLDEMIETLKVEDLQFHNNKIYP